MTQCIRGRIITPISTTKIREIVDGVLCIDDRGRILSCEPYLPTHHVTKYMPDHVIFPGLVDVHSHIPQLDERGKCGKTLLNWLDHYIFPAEKSFSNMSVVQDIGIRFFKKLILNGTTTACLFSSIHKDATDACFQIADQAGVRACIGKVMMDQHAPYGLIETTDDALTQSAMLCEKWHGHDCGRLQYAFTPRFAPTCSLDLWTESAKLARQMNAYLHTHIAETKKENQTVRAMYPQYKDYVDLFESCDVLGEKTIFAHAIYLSDDEFARIAESKSKIAHCPTSNLFLKSGCMPADKIEQYGIDYGLGTDVGAGTSMSIFTEMRHADYVQSDFSVSPKNAFYLATLGGAHVLGLQDQIGSLDVGKWADFIAMDIRGVDPNYNQSQLTADEILSILMYRGDGHSIKQVYVAGNQLDVDAI